MAATLVAHTTTLQPEPNDGDSLLGGQKTGMLKTWMPTFVGMTRTTDRFRSMGLSSSRLLLAHWTRTWAWSAGVTILAGMTTRRSAFMTVSKTATRSVPLRYPSKTAWNSWNGPRTTFTGAPSGNRGFERSTSPSAHREINSSIT